MKASGTANSPATVIVNVTREAIVHDDEGKPAVSLTVGPDPSMVQVKQLPQNSSKRKPVAIANLKDAVERLVDGR